MKKLAQGKYEVYTTKEDAIHRLRQMQGYCREEISGENTVEFQCSKKGEIIISDFSRKSISSDCSIQLRAGVIRQDNKTYIAYQTEFSKGHNIFKTIFIILQIIGLFIAAWVMIKLGEIKYLWVLLFSLVFSACLLFRSLKEESNSSKDSEILIKELEKRVDAVNHWDK